MDALDKAIDELTETDWQVIRTKIWCRLSYFASPADREDATHDALLRLADMLDQDKPLRLMIHIAARRELDHCSPQSAITLPNGKRRTRRGAPTYRPLPSCRLAIGVSPERAREIEEDREAEDEAEGINQPRDWQALSYGEIVEAGLVSAKRERIAG